MLSYGFKDNIEVLSNGVDTNLYNANKKDYELKKKICTKGEKLILHVGRITKEKKTDSLIRIAKNLQEKNIKFKMVIVGEGPYLNKLKGLVKSLDLKNNIIFVGYLDKTHLPAYYATADIFLTASTVETQGIVLLESLASGLPVIGADAGAIPELIDGKNGFVFDPKNFEQASNLIEEVFVDENIRKELSKNCKPSIQGHEIESVAAKLEKIYKKLI